MTERLSNTDLDRLEALAEGATPGPWVADVNEVSQAWSRPEPWLPVVSTEVSCMTYCHGGSAPGVEKEADAEFIAASRNALLAAFPWLADSPSDVEAGARALFEDLYTWTQMVAAAAGARYTRGGGSMAASADPHTPTPFDPKEI